MAKWSGSSNAALCCLTTSKPLNATVRSNDLWIAACALRHGLVLATREQHFDQVEDLWTEAW